MFILHTSPLRGKKSSPPKILVYFKIGLILNKHALKLILHYTLKNFDLPLSFAFIMRSLRMFVCRHSLKYYLKFFSKSGDFPKERKNRICQRISRNLCKQTCVKFLTYMCTLAQPYCRKVPSLVVRRGHSFFLTLMNVDMRAEISSWSIYCYGPTMAALLCIPVFIVLQAY